MSDKEPTIEELVPQIRAYYASAPENASGGSLHIVLDDGNVEDEMVIWCQGYAAGREDSEGQRLAELILKLPALERMELARMQFWP